eukprot:TRINITY_DN49121_c0_g1_i2.p1 TRINITY_DN49121_c0_g1~~TRINITY_DN49121_c0_g1_i2.p1  ORF type:complete len:302 (+),score=73.88 TRINITY_DN49121_c0_g1_i2:91-996(+)
MIVFFFFFFKQKTAYEMLRSLVGSEMCIRDRLMAIGRELRGFETDGWDQLWDDMVRRRDAVASWANKLVQVVCGVLLSCREHLRAAEEASRRVTPESLVVLVVRPGRLEEQLDKLRALQGALAAVPPGGIDPVHAAEFARMHEETSGLLLGYTNNLLGIVEDLVQNLGDSCVDSCRVPLHLSELWRHLTHTLLAPRLQESELIWNLLERCGWNDQRVKNLNDQVRAALQTTSLNCTAVAPSPEYRTIMRSCLLYTSDAADEEDSVDLGGRRILKKKKTEINNRDERDRAIVTIKIKKRLTK